jgi:DNA polymerase kappa
MMLRYIRDIGEILARVLIGCREVDARARLHARSDVQGSKHLSLPTDISYEDFNTAWDMSLGDEKATKTADSEAVYFAAVSNGAEDVAVNREEDLIKQEDTTAVISAHNGTPPQSQHHTLRHHLLGPSLTKAGQDGVDQRKVSDIIYEASKGSKYFNNEQIKDKNLTSKISRILKLKSHLEKQDLKSDLRKADQYIEELELSRDLSQYLVHIDCDAFYAAVEEIDRPELKNLPMAVGIGVITTCNYAARKYGCRSAMAGFVAKKLCPELICLPLNLNKYTAKAREVRAILSDYDPRFESSSIDEAYLNVTEYCQNHDLTPDEAIEQLRREVSEKCKITISAGIAPNAKIAKICSNRNKPNGQFRVANDRAAVMSFMAILPVRKVNGVGRVLERSLSAIGVQTCGDIYLQRQYLARLFGEKAFQFLLQTYLGLGRTDVSPAEEHERKSVGTESTFHEISSKEELREKLRHTAEELERDMSRVGVKGRTLVLKIKLHTYEVFTRQVQPPKAVCLADDLYNFALPMLRKLEAENPGFRLRLMGLRCSHLVSTKRSELDFFGRSGKVSTRQDSSSNMDGDGWEVWPDAEFEEAARQERQDEIDEIERLSQEHHDAGDEDPWATADWHEPFGRYKYGSSSGQNSPAKAQAPAQAAVEQQAWECPVCQVPQTADEKSFNEHVDLCLSRQTIKEAVADAVKAVPKEFVAEVPNRPGSAAGKRKLKSEDGVDHRQKRLFFA